MVANISASFFVINNIDKESRIINLSFSADDPEDYIDCGITERTSELNGEVKHFSYQVAGDSHYQMAANWGAYQNLGALADVQRDLSLEGRINIYAAPKGPEATRIAVNARYILTGKTSGRVVGYNAFGQVAQTSAIPEQSTSISFNTSTSGSANWGTPAEPLEVKCISNGTLEKRLLGMAAGPTR
jgi:hypothetical protein